MIVRVVSERVASMAESFWAGPGVAGMVWMRVGASGAVASRVRNAGQPFVQARRRPGMGRSVMADSRAAARREGSGPSTGWPSWARRLVTAGSSSTWRRWWPAALGVPPSSELERRIANLFTPYHDLVDQGYAYRYYAEPPPTPVITATLRFGDGRPDETVRLPGRSLGGPRMRHQRQLALANALFADFQEAKQAWRRRRPEPAGARLCPPPLPGPSRLHGGHPPRPAAPDPRPRARPRGPRVARRSAGSTSSTRTSSPPRNGSETSRATAPERDLAATWPSWPSATRRGWNAFFFTPADPDGAGPDPRGGRPAGLLEPVRLRSRPARLPSARTAGPTRP